MPDDYKPIDQYVSYALAAAHRSVNSSLAARLKKHGVQVEAWRILECLDTGQRLTMGKLAELVLINPPTLSKLVDRMVSDGLVHRQIAQSDHRQVNLLLTSIGRKRMMKIRTEIEEQCGEIVNLIGPEESKVLVKLLKGLAHHPE